MESAECTIAEYLAIRLAEIGVRHIFSVPGDFIVPFLQTIDNLGVISRVGNTTEMEAGYAADGYARICGVGAVAVTYGVGSLSVLNAIAGAYVERVPIVVVNGSPGTDKRLIDRDTGLTWHHMIVDAESRDLSIYRNVTAMAIQVNNPSRAPLDIDAALTTCMSERLPVYLEMFEDLYGVSCQRPTSPLVYAPGPSVAANLNAAVTAAVGKIRSSNRPLIWAGAEIRQTGVADQLEELIAQTAIPFTTSLAGKSVISESNQMFRGVYDGLSSNPATAALFNASDCLITLGAWPTDINLLGTVGAEMLGTGPWGAGPIRALRGSVHVGGAYYAQVNLGDFITELTINLATYRYIGPGDRPPTGVTPPTPAPNDPLTFDSFFQRMTSAIDDSDVVVADIGFSGLGSMDITMPTRNGYVSQAVWASIGYAVPAAIGVSCAFPDKRPIVFAGDGAIHMTIQAFSTMLNTGISPVIFVMNNGIYGVEQWLVDASVYAPPGDPGRVTPINKLNRWEFSKAPGLFGGGVGYRVETLAQLDVALAAIAEAPHQLTIVDVRLPELSVPACTQWKIKATPAPALVGAS
jgi:indolepyruvate decarboxylase